jgi:hypothetical protein
MVCLEYEKIWQDIVFHQKNLKYFLFDKALHRLSDGKAKESAREAALALARVSNRLYWHESQCSICMRARVHGSVSHKS